MSGNENNGEELVEMIPLKIKSEGYTDRKSVHGVLDEISDNEDEVEETVGENENEKEKEKADALSAQMLLLGAIPPEKKKVEETVEEEEKKVEKNVSLQGMLKDMEGDTKKLDRMSTVNPILLKKLMDSYIAARESKEEKRQDVLNNFLESEFKSITLEMVRQVRAILTTCSVKYLNFFLVTLNKTNGPMKLKGLLTYKFVMPLKLNRKKVKNLPLQAEEENMLLEIIYCLKECLKTSQGFWAVTKDVQMMKDMFMLHLHLGNLKIRIAILQFLTMISICNQEGLEKVLQSIDYYSTLYKKKNKFEELAHSMMKHKQDSKFIHACLTFLNALVSRVKRKRCDLITEILDTNIDQVVRKLRKGKKLSSHLRSQIEVFEKLVLSQLNAAEMCRKLIKRFKSTEQLNRLSILLKDLYTSNDKEMNRKLKYSMFLVKNEYKNTQQTGKSKYLEIELTNKMLTLQEEHSRMKRRYDNLTSVIERWDLKEMNKAILEHADDDPVLITLLCTLKLRMSEYLAYVTTKKKTYCFNPSIAKEEDVRNMMQIPRGAVPLFPNRSIYQKIKKEEEEDEGEDDDDDEEEMLSPIPGPPDDYDEEVGMETEEDMESSTVFSQKTPISENTVPAVKPKGIVGSESTGSESDVSTAAPPPPPPPPGGGDAGGFSPPPPPGLAGFGMNVKRTFDDLKLSKLFKETKKKRDEMEQSKSIQKRYLRLQTVSNNKIDQSIFIKGGLAKRAHKFYDEQLQNCFRDFLKINKDNEKGVEGASPKTSKRKRAPPKKQLLDEKMSHRAEVGLRTVRITDEEFVEAFKKFNEEKLPPRLIEKVHSFLPPMNVLATIRKYEGGIDEITREKMIELSRSSQFCLRVSVIPKILSKIACWHYRNNYEDLTRSIEPQLSSFIRSGKCVTTSESFKDFLQYILLVANLMSKKDLVVSFRMKSLEQLARMKVSNRSLLSYLVGYIKERKQENVLMWRKELRKPIKGFLGVNFDHVRDEISAVEREKEKLKNLLENVTNEEGAMESYVVNMKPFLTKINNDHGQWKKMYDEVMSLVKEMSVLFAEDEDYIKNDFFKVINSFITEINKAEKQFGRWKKLESRKNRRKAKLEKKMKKAKEEEMEKKNPRASLEMQQMINIKELQSKIDSGEIFSATIKDVII